MNAQSLALILSLALNTSASVSTPANLFNQYTKVGVATYASDANGNLTSDGTRTYTYDFANRLLTATGPGLSATSTYDGLGRRVTKTVNGVLTRYLYDGASILEERSATNTLQASSLWGPSLDELLTMTRGGTTSYVLADALGSTVALTDASGTLLESVTYDAYGLPLSLSHLGNPYFFTGREYDTETGLYNLRARSYDPRIGRFLQRDPLGDGPDVNLYRYVKNNPVNFTDPFGLEGGSFFQQLNVWLHGGDVFITEGGAISAGLVSIYVGGTLIGTTWAIPVANLITVPTGLVVIGGGLVAIYYGGQLIYYEMGS